jgi:hypothetical protein
VLWYLALVAAVGALLRRLFPTALGALALIIFTVDESHFVPVAWLANRNALVAATPAVLALVLHLKWREDGSRWALPVSLLAWVIALAGGESAVGVVGYMVAYESLSAKGPVRERALALAPLGGVLLGYAWLYRHLGYGASGSGVYLDPHTPAAYLVALPTRMLALTGGALLKVPSELGATSLPVHWVAWAAGAAAIALFSWLAARAWPTLSDLERRHLRWLAAGAVLSLLALASTFPSNRLLLVPSLGASAVIAALLRWAAQRGARPTLALLTGLHVVLPLVAWGVLTWVGCVAIDYAERASIEVELDPERVASERVAVLGAPDPIVGAYVSLMRQTHHQPVPAVWWPLTLMPVDQRLTRTGPASFTLEPLEGRFLGSLFELLFRGLDHPFHPKDTVALDGLQVTIEAADEAGLQRAAFAFDCPLEDPSLRLLVWRDGRLRRFTPPAIGEAVVLHVEGAIPLLR